MCCEDLLNRKKTKKLAEVLDLVPADGKGTMNDGFQKNKKKGKAGGNKNKNYAKSSQAGVDRDAEEERVKESAQNLLDGLVALRTAFEKIKWGVFCDSGFKGREWLVEEGVA